MYAGRKTDLQEVKKSMEESLQLQKEAAGLQEAMEQALAVQVPVVRQDRGGLRGQEDPHGLHGPQTGMLLLKVRVFLKTMRELEQKSILLGEKMEALQEVLRRTEGSVRAVFEGLQSSAGDGAVPEKLHRSAAGRVVSERLRSLSVSRALVLQLQAEAGTLAAAYAELESALAEAGRAADQAAQIRLSKAAAGVKETIEKARRAGGY